MNPQSDFFEKYGDYLLRQGYPTLAIRTWNLCAQSGPIPEQVAEKIRQQELSIEPENFLAIWPEEHPARL